MDEIVPVAAGGGPAALRQDADAAVNRAGSTRLLYAAVWQHSQLGALPAASGRSPPLLGRWRCSCAGEAEAGRALLPSQGGWPPSAGRAASPTSWPVSGDHAPRRWRKRPRPTRTC